MVTPSNWQRQERNKVFTLINLEKTRKKQGIYTN